jgi:MFS family permease
MAEQVLAASGAARADEGVFSARLRPLTIGLVLVVASAAFEALAVAATMPATTRELGGLALYGWAFSAFMLTNLVGVTLAGSAADRNGPARPFLIGIGLFIIGLLGAGLAPLMPMLIAARAVQGLGAGMISSVAYVAIGRGYPEGAKARMLAMTSTAWVVPGLIGPAVAGVITDFAGWRWVFLGLVPLPIIATLLALPVLRRMGRPAQRAANSDDAAALNEAAAGEPRQAQGTSAARNAIQLAGGVGLVMAGLGQSAQPLLAVGLAVAGVALAGPAIRRMMPAGTLRAAPGMPAAIVAMCFLNLAFFGVDAFVPLALSELRRQSIVAAGLPLTAATLTWTAGSWVLAQIAGRVSRRSIASVGLGLVGAGIAVVIVTLLPAVPAFTGIGAWALAGLGIGLAYTTLSLAVLESAPAGQEGKASAAMQVASGLGTAIGTGVGGTIVGSGSAGVSAARITIQCGLMIAVALLGAAVALRIGKQAGGVEAGSS